MRRRLVLPEPLGPPMRSNSPPFSAKERLSKRVRSPRTQRRSAASSEGVRGIFRTAELCGGELGPDLGEQALGVAAAHAGDVVLILEQSAERVVDSLRVERHLV